MQKSHDDLLRSDPTRSSQGNMVLRKPSPRGAGPLPYPISPTSTPASNDPATFTSQETAYSPSLHQSPAFNLQSLDEAQKAPSHFNPWTKEGQAERQSHNVQRLPTILQAGSGRPAAEKPQESSLGMPDISKAGYNDKATPRSSLDSQRSRGFWEDEDEDDQGPAPETACKEPETASPQSAGSKNKPSGNSNSVPNSFDQDQDQGQNLNHTTLASNNPFRRAESGDGIAQQHTGGSVVESEFIVAPNFSTADRSVSEFSSSYRPSKIDLGADFRSQTSNPLPAAVPSVSKPAHPSRPPPLPPVHSISSPTHPLGPPPPVPLYSPSGVGEQPPLIPVTPQNAHGRTPWTEDPAQPSVVSQTHQNGMNGEGYHKFNVTEDQGGQSGFTGSGKDSLPIPETEEAHSATSLLDADIDPQLPTFPFERNSFEDFQSGLPDTDVPFQHPAGPSFVREAVSEAELAKLREQRNETYQIKHFNWFDHNTQRLRRSSMLTQNQNGPCPLLALVNAIILSAPDDSRSALGHALESREQVSLGLIIESLMDELTSDGRGGINRDLPDVDELNRFLLMLHSGMNANPKLVAAGPPTLNLMGARDSARHLSHLINDDRNPGSFEETQDIVLYGAFSIPLVHGWLPPRSDPARTAFARSAPTYEDAQTIQFGEEELEHKLFQSGLTPDEQQLLQDIVSIKSFLKSYPTQLSPYGLGVISESLHPGAFAIMFRNDHFSTIYKDPDSRQLFTLVTDAGYSDKAEVIWESLVDVNGRKSEFFSGDFRPVGNNEPSTIPAPRETRSSAIPIDIPSNRRHSSARHLDVQSVASPTSPASPHEQQEQADADFAMALQLQEEEEARADPTRRRAPQPSLRPSQSSTPSRERNASIPIRTRSPARDRNANIPIRLRSQDEIRPVMPPRTQRPAVNRPPNNNPDEAAPPTYEEAAKGSPYIPPPGHPQHPSSDPSPSPQISSPAQPANSSPSPAARQGRAAAPQRRTSAFQENSQLNARLNNPRTDMPRQPGMIRPEMMRPHSHNVGVVQGPGRPRDNRDNNCVIM